MGDLASKVIESDPKKQTVYIDKRQLQFALRQQTVRFNGLTGDATVNIPDVQPQTVVARGDAAIVGHSVKQDETPTPTYSNIGTGFSTADDGSGGVNVTIPVGIATDGSVGYLTLSFS